MEPMYLIKYSATTGVIQKITNYELSDSGIYVYTKPFWSSFQIGKDIFRTEEEARAALEAAVDKKITSLKKQLNKIMNLKITVKE